MPPKNPKPPIPPPDAATQLRYDELLLQYLIKKHEEKRGYQKENNRAAIRRLQEKIDLQKQNINSLLPEPC